MISGLGPVTLADILVAAVILLGIVLWVYTPREVREDRDQETERSRRDTL